MPPVALQYIQCPECDSDIKVGRAAQWVHCVRCGHDFLQDDELSD